MVLKAVPIYTSDQSDDLRLAPKARLVGRSASGPLQSFAGFIRAALQLSHCGHSFSAQHFVGLNVGQRTKRPFVMVENTEMAGQ